MGLVYGVVPCLRRSRLAGEGRTRCRRPTWPFGGVGDPWSSAVMLLGVGFGGPYQQPDRGRRGGFAYTLVGET